MRFEAGGIVSSKKIVVVTPFQSDDWVWFSEDLTEYEWSIKNLNLFSKKAWFWVLRVLPLIFQIARADLVVSLSPQMSLSTAIWMRLFGIRTPHLAYGFNHGDGRFFSGMHGVIAKWAFKGIWGVVVFSEAEKEIYSNAYGIPVEKFSFTHWAVKDPDTNDAWWSAQNFEGKYICSLGRNNRDWKSLLEAAQSIPVKFVLVCTRDALQGLNIPANVTVLHDLTSAQCSSIVKKALLNVVPILDDSRGAGHITVVNSMKLGVPLVITNNATLHDYFVDGQHGSVYDANNVISLENSIRKIILANDGDHVLSRQCKDFAEEWFTEAATKRSLEALLQSAFTGAPFPPGGPLSWTVPER